MIYPSVPFFPEKDKEFILTEFKKILDGEGFLTDSAWNRKFEEEFAKYIGTKYAITTTNGTTALELIYRALNLNDIEVIVPANTFAATVNPLISIGAKPVFADIGNDFSLDPYDVENKLTDNTKVIVVVHIGGFVSENIKTLQDLAKDNNLLLIEDSAQAVGSMFNGQKAGSFGVASGFSFFSTKVLAIGEGGMVTTDDEQLYNEMKLIRDHYKEKVGIYQNYHRKWGSNYRMTEVQALMGLTQLRNLEEFIYMRKKIADIYYQELYDFKAFDLPTLSRPNWYKWIGLTENRERLYKLAKEKGVSMGGMVYEFPLHLLPAFEDYKTDLPNAEELCSLMFCPPIHPQMSIEDAMKVSDVIREIINL